MVSKFILFSLFILNSIVSFAQPATICEDANCNEVNEPYPSQTGVPSIGEYDCLFTTPNANWIAFSVPYDGPISLTISQPGDVDFAAYGPFTSVAEGCPIGPSTVAIDCSYSPSATETVNIPNALQGEVYILLVTNFSDQGGSINITGDIECNINYTVETSMTPATCNQASGSVTATPNGGFPPYTYLWDIPGNPTTQTVNNVAPGTYTVTMTSSPNPEIGIIPAPVTNTITVTNEEPNYNSTATFIDCPGGYNGSATAFMTPQIGNISYLWDDPLGQTTQTAIGLTAGIYNCIITSDFGCFGSISQNVNETPLTPLTISSITPDSQICPEDEIILTATGTGGNSPLTFSWFDKNQFIGNGSTITVDPDESPYSYSVVLSEECDTPIDSASVTITFPTPILPIIEPNQHEDCLVGEFDFYNNSINREEIATTYFDFGDQNSTIEIGFDSTSHSFNSVGNKTVNVTITSIYGCVYEGVFEDIVRVIPLPNANFNFSQNPASTFENTVTLFDNSSTDVIDWQWFTPDLIPISSIEEDPTFTYPLDIEAEYPIMLVVTSNFGCIDTINLSLKVKDELLFYAPNTFTPNNDEFNQNWGISLKGGAINDYNLKIFNRWGGIIWETNDPSANWDGTYNGSIVKTGTYIWKASMRNENNDGKVEFNGYINLLK